MTSRRKFVKSAVGSATSIGFVGTALAQNNDVGTEEVGLRETIDRLISKGRFDELESLLNKHDIDFGHGSKLVKRPRHDEGDVEPQWKYSEEGTTLHCLVIQQNPDDDRWHAYGYVSFDEDANESSYAGVPNKVADGCGLIFDSSEWSSPDPSEDNMNYSTGGDDSRFLDIEHEKYNPNCGPTAKVHHEMAEPINANATMRTTLTQADTGNEDIDVQFAYEHTTSYFSATGSVTVGIAYGALSVSLPVGASTAWRDEVTGSP